jgi:hypothetical protein
MNDDVSLISEPDMGNGGIFFCPPVPFADVTVGESAISVGEWRHAYGVRRDGNLESVAEQSTVAGGGGDGDGDGDSGWTAFGEDDATLEAAACQDGAVGSRAGGAPRRLVAIAPAGKVGIVLDNVSGGLPFVHSVKADSPLRGIVDVGDFLLSVDEVDCHGMSAVEASQVITARGHRERRLVLLRRTSTGDVEEGSFELDPRYASF